MPQANLKFSKNHNTAMLTYLELATVSINPNKNDPIFKYKFMLLIMKQLKTISVKCSLFLLFLAPVSVLAQVNSRSVTPVKWAQFNMGNPTDSLSLTQRDILLNAVNYGLTTWYNKVKKYNLQKGNYLDFGGIKEHNIRANGSEALAIAVALKTGIYRPDQTGLTSKNATEIAVKLIKSVAFRHKANSAGGWGDDWQSALWAAYAGSAGWLLWDDLSVADQVNVQKMVEYEADRLKDYAVPYMVDRAGKTIYKGDSKSEENSWNSMILQVALAMMPKHPNFKTWMNKNIELLLSASARPSDINSNKRYNGKKLKDILNGSNYNNDGTVTNHGRIHPDYMACASQTFFNILVFTLAGKPAPKAALFNTDIIYQTIVDHKFQSPPFLAPGGTIYIRGSAKIYYPQTNDWGTGRKMHFALLDCQSAAFGADRLATLGGKYWEHFHASAVLQMQERSKDGRTYLDANEDTYIGREEWVAVHAAQAYLTKWLEKQKKIRITNKKY